MKRQASYADIEALAENQVGELIAGDLVVSPRPSGPHARASSVLGMELGPPFDRGRGGPGGWVILDEPELHLGPDVLVPDLAGWRIERLPAIPQDHRFKVAPDWVCEVLSPSSARYDRVAKLNIYLREQTAHVWIVDPRSRTLEVFRHQGENWLLERTFSDEAGHKRVRAEPFSAVEIELAALWVPQEGS
ncbi:MAG: Uma2 family endonuclease [Myxococcota bacterium]